MKDRRSRSLKARVANNLSWALSAQVITSAFGLATLFVTTRALGPAGFGILALVEAYVRIVDRLLRLEPWQATIKYGIAALERDDSPAFLKLAKLSILIDLVGGCLSGGVALLLATTVAPLIGLPPDHGAQYIALVAIASFLSLRPTGIFVLRSLDRFDRLSMIDIFSAFVRLSLSALAFYFELGLVAFLAILLIQSLLDGLLAFFAAMHEMKRRNYGKVMRVRARDAISENPGFLRVLWNSNLNVVLRQSANRFDVLVLGVLLDSTSVGFYQLGKRVMNNFIKIAGPIRQAVYPEMARLWSNGRKQTFLKLVAVISFSILGMLALISAPLVFEMDRVIVRVFGEGFREAAPVVTVLLVSAIVFLSGAVLNPALLAMGHDALLTKVTLAATVLFAVSFVPFVYMFGVVGGAASNLLFNVIWTIGCLIGFRRALRR